MPKAKVLIAEQFDKSGFKILRVYLELDFDQAKKDMQLLQDASDDKNIKLIDVELYRNHA